mgnify:CR=1 FL=1
MNTTNPLGGIHAALDRYEADGRPPAAELPPTRGAEAALLENFDESESDAGDTLQEWRERCLRAEDAYAAMQKDGMRDRLEAQERITAELHAKLADADQRYKAELSMREEAEAVVEELQTRPRTGTALDEIALLNPCAAARLARAHPSTFFSSPRPAVRSR